MPTNSPNASSGQQPSSDSDFLGAASLDEFKQRFSDALTQIEGQTREAPSRALLYALGIGYILARLPVFGILFTFARLALMAIKPAVLVYIGTLAYRRLTEGENAR